MRLPDSRYEIHSGTPAAAAAIAAMNSNATWVDQPRALARGHQILGHSDPRALARGWLGPSCSPAIFGRACDAIRHLRKDFKLHLLAADIVREILRGYRHLVAARR